VRAIYNNNDFTFYVYGRRRIKKFGTNRVEKRDKPLWGRIFVVPLQSNSGNKITRTALVQRSYSARECTEKYE